MPHSVIQRERISLTFWVETMRARVDVPLTLLNDVSLEGRQIVERHVHRPGLVMAGYDEHFEPQRLQVLGNTETRFLLAMDKPQRRDAFARLIAHPMPCLVLTAGNTLPAVQLRQATERGLPVFRTPLTTTRFLTQATNFLEDQFAQQTSLHGSLVDVYGVGVLMQGKAGIGKSEVALDLVERGHRLVADDVVMATRKHDILMGAGTDLVQHFMEIRGLGLIDVRAMFGIRAIRFQKRIELVVNLQLWDPEADYTRVDMIDEHQDVLGVQLPLVRLPVTPGKNITVICEVIAMNYLLRHYGYNPADVFAKRLRERLSAAPGHPLRATEYFEQDDEKRPPANVHDPSGRIPCGEVAGSLLIFTKGWLFRL
jgi:HPr kinase/phosphorylase